MAPGVTDFIKGFFVTSGLAKYELLSKMDEGRMSIIHRARDKRTMRTCLLKIYKDDCLRIRNAVRRKEPQIDEVLLSIDHPYVMKIFEFGNTKGQEYTAIEAINGVALGAMAREGKLTLRNAVSVFAKAAEGLAYLHDEKHLVHRDLNPFNIVVTAELDPKIIDLDFALIEMPDTSGMYRRSGTVAYLSPEQVRGHHLDHRVDIYALGVTIYEVVTGTNPYWDRTQENEQARLDRTTYNHLVMIPEPPSTIRAGVPPELDRIILGCLEVDRDVRTQTAVEVMQGLKDVLAKMG
jgi:eukaryotic-like serine/threonine-protein kinase